LGHPFWTAVFLAEIIAVIFFPEPIGLWRFLTWALLVLAETGLVTSMLAGSLLRFPVIYLAAVTLALCVVKSFSLPAPLFRVLLAFIGGLGAVLFLRWARRLRSSIQDDAAPRRLAPFWILMLLAGIQAVIFFAQLFGLVKVAERLLFEVLGLITLGLGAFLCLRIVEAGVSLAVTRSALTRLRFFRRFGNEITARLHFVLRIAIVVLTSLGLLRLMGVYGSAGQAFDRFFSFSVHVGSLVLTPGVLILALFLMYLANSLSWFLRAVLDAEVFPRKQMESGAAHAISKLLHYLLMFVGFLMAMSVIGLEMKNFAVLGGALGIGVGFGLQNIVNNFMSGLILLFERPIKVGDRVVVDSDLGLVKRIGLRSTVIQTFDYAELIVPNSQFISAKVTNMTLSSTMVRLKIPVGAAYGADIELVLRTLRETGEANPRVAKDPAPLALMLQFGASSLDFELQVWLPNIGDLALARSELCQDIARRFQEAGIEIPFPQCDVHLKQSGTE
jgi:small-conductance mechanosensitive channel